MENRKQDQVAIALILPGWTCGNEAAKAAKRCRRSPTPQALPLWRGSEAFKGMEQLWCRTALSPGIFKPGL